MVDKLSGRVENAAREKLADVVRRLEIALGDVDGGFVSLSEGDASFLSHAIAGFLSGKSASLDSAFGLARKRGRPKSGPRTERNMALVKTAMKSRAKTWDGVASDPAVSNLAGRSNIDASTLRKLVNRHRSEAIDELTSELVSELKKRHAERQAKARHE